MVVRLNRILNIYLNLYFHFFALVPVQSAPLSFGIQHAMLVLILGSLHLSCCMRDTTWSWFDLIFLYDLIGLILINLIPPHNHNENRLDRRTYTQIDGPFFSFQVRNPDNKFISITVNKRNNYDLWYESRCTMHCDSTRCRWSRSRW